jgi:hypothetical protein
MTNSGGANGLREQLGPTPSAPTRTVTPWCSTSTPCWLANGTQLRFKIASRNSWYALAPQALENCSDAPDSVLSVRARGKFQLVRRR